MKNILYILAVVAIGAGAIFGWQVKDKTEVQLTDLDTLKRETSNLSKTITDKEGEKMILQLLTKKLVRQRMKPLPRWRPKSASRVNFKRLSL